LYDALTRLKKQPAVVDTGIICHTERLVEKHWAARVAEALVAMGTLDYPPVVEIATHDRSSQPWQARWRAPDWHTTY
jgi:hypothetical protein